MVFKKIHDSGTLWLPFFRSVASLSLFLPLSLFLSRHPLNAQEEKKETGALTMLSPLSQLHWSRPTNLHHLRHPAQFPWASFSELPALRWQTWHWGRPPPLWSESFSNMSLRFLRAVAALSSPPRGSGQFRRQPKEYADRLRSWPPAQLEADRLHRVRAVSFFSVLGDGDAAESCCLPPTFATAVGPLIVTSSHCSWSLPGTVATTSILATLISSVPCLSLHCFDHCGATLQVGRGSLFANLSGQAV